jgi:hypothetical protein
VKIFMRSQFEELAVQLTKNLADQLDLPDEQIEFTAKVVAKTMTHCLLAAGYQLPWVKRRRH